MGLSALVSSAIKTANGVTASLQVSVQHFAWIGQDAKGKKAFAGAASYPALVERKQKRMPGPDGQEVFSRYSVTFLQPLPANGTAGRQEPIDTRDELVLPNGERVDVLDVSGMLNPDTGAPYMSEVWTS
jgi:hypothetical protein